MPDRSTTSHGFLRRGPLAIAMRRVPLLSLVGGVDGLRRLADEWNRAREHQSAGEIMRDLTVGMPHVVTLLWGLARDQRVALRHRAALVALVPYLASPVDLIPDFVPVLGAMDDVVLVVATLRWVVRNVEPEVLDEHWHGPPLLFDLLRRLVDAPRVEYSRVDHSGS